MSEHNEQAALFELLSRNENKYPFLKWIFAVPNGGHRNIAVARKLKAEGVRAGVPDIFIPIPKGEYHGMFLEMKFGKNAATADQTRFGCFLADQGYHILICRSWIEAAEAIAEYLEINLFS